MRLIGVVSTKEGGGADSAHIEVVEWDDTFGGGAGEMRGGTFVVTMVSAPTVPAGACVRTITAVMSRVFAVALETIWIRRKMLLSFAQQ